MINITPEMNLTKKSDSLFDDEFKDFVPKEGEVRLIANRNKECLYYYLGIEQCRARMLKLSGNPNSEKHNLGFLPCKRLVDAHYRCMTDDKYGYTVEEAPEVSKENVDAFFNCAFKKIHPLSSCRKFFDGVVRNIYRSPDNQLLDYY